MTRTSSFDEVDMSRHSYLYRNVPLIDGNLGLSVPRISRQSVKLPTTVVNSSAVKRVPPLSLRLYKREIQAQLKGDNKNRACNVCWE